MGKKFKSTNPTKSEAAMLRAINVRMDVVGTHLPDVLRDILRASLTPEQREALAPMAEKVVEIYVKLLGPIFDDPNIELPSVPELYRQVVASQKTLNDQLKHPPTFMVTQPNANEKIGIINQFLPYNYGIVCEKLLEYIIDDVPYVDAITQKTPDVADTRDKPLAPRVKRGHETAWQNTKITTKFVQWLAGEGQLTEAVLQGRWHVRPDAYILAEKAETLEELKQLQAKRDVPQPAAEIFTEVVKLYNAEMQRVAQTSPQYKTFFSAMQVFEAQLGEHLQQTHPELSTAQANLITRICSDFRDTIRNHCITSYELARRESDGKA